MPRLLFDISLLGFGGAQAGRITGMPRYMVELATHLAQRGDCRVTLCACETIPEAHAIAQQHPALRHLPFTELTPTAVSQAQVYHSTHGPVPAWVREHPHLAIVQTVHDMIPFLLPETLPPSYVTYYGEMVRQLQPARDVVVTVSQATKRDFCQHTGWAGEHVHVTPLAASTEQFQPCPDPARQAQMRQRYGIPSGPYLLSLCTLEPRKNLPHLIQSFLALRQTQPLAAPLHLVLAGRVGWKAEPILAALAGTDPAQHQVHPIGYVEDDDLAALYSGALAFAYLSRYEGFGLPLLEAMQCGTPVIAANTSSLPEVVGEAGALVSPDSPADFTQALLRLLTNSTERSRQSTAARVQAAHFSWPRCTEATVIAYHAALHRKA